MMPLPSAGVVAFEDFLRERWSSKRYATRRDALACSLGLAGLRWEEVSRVRWTDVDQRDGRLAVRSAKGGIRRILPIGVCFASALRLLRFYGGQRFGDEHVFLTLKGKRVAYEHMNRTIRRFTLIVFRRPFTFHCLRHTAAVRMYEATGDVLKVQRFLGHRSLMWTEVYLRSLVDPGFEEGLPTFCGGVAGPALRVVSFQEAVAEKDDPLRIHGSMVAALEAALKERKEHA